MTEPNVSSTASIPTILLDRNDTPQRKVTPRSKRHLTFVDDDGDTFTSDYAIGEWVRYGNNFIGIISGITYQDEEPIISNLYSSWTGNWHESGFRYRIRPNDQYDSWEEVNENLIVSLVDAETSEYLDGVWWSQLHDTKLESIVRYALIESDGMLPNPSSFERTVLWWHRLVEDISPSR